MSPARLRQLAARHGYALLGTAFCLVLAVQLGRELAPASAADQPANVASRTQSIVAALAAQDFIQAKRLAQNYIKRNPKGAEGHFLLGQSEFHSGNVRAAVDHTLAATELDPSEPRYRIFLADGYAVIGWLAKAEEQITLALELQPENLDLLARRAELLLALGKADKALEDLNYGISVSNGDPELLLRRADLFYRTNQLAKARRDLEQVRAGDDKRKAEIAAEILARINER